MPSKETPTPLYDSKTDTTLEQLRDDAAMKVRGTKIEFAELAEQGKAIAARKQELARAIAVREAELGISKKTPAKESKQAETKSAKKESKAASPKIKKEEVKEPEMSVAAPVERVPYSAPSPFEKETPRDAKADLARLSENYAKKGLGEIAAKLNELAEFQALTSGQKMLVLQGANDKLLEYVEENSQKDFNQKMQAVSEKYAGRTGRLAKATRWAHMVAVGARKGYLTSGKRKEILKGALGEDAGKFVAEVAPELISVLGDTGLESYLDKDGKTVVTDFAGMESDLKNGSPLARQIAAEYNQAASMLARIPEEWRLDSATKSEKDKYKKAQLAFTAVQERLSPELIEHARRIGTAEDPQVFAASYLENSENLVSTMSFLSAHPDAAKRIKQINNRSALRGSLGDVTWERALIAGGSYLGKKMLTIAGPVVGTVVGYYRGKDRAKKSLNEQDRLARRGERQKGATTIGMGSVDRHLARLADYRDRILNSTSDIERAKLASELKTRVDFIEAKLELGQVNFGDTKGRFMRRYELGKLLHEAQVAISVHSAETEIQNVFLNAEGGLQGDARTRRLIRAQGSMNAEQVELARTEQIKVQARRSAFYGGIAGTIGASFSYLHHNYGIFGHADFKVAVPTHHTPGLSYDEHAMKDYTEHAHGGESYEQYAARLKMNQELGDKLAHAHLHGGLTAQSVEKSDTMYVNGNGKFVMDASPKIDHLAHAAGPLPHAEFHGSGHLRDAVDKNFMHPKHPDLTKLHAPAVQHPDTSATMHVNESGKLVDTGATAEHAVAAAPKLDASHAAASVEFSPKGIEQTLLNLRHSPNFKNLAPEQQKFFEGRIASIAKEIKGFRPGAADGKESISFAHGARFNISSDGKIFVTEGAAGKTTLLGHLEGSTFKADANEADLHYIHAGPSSVAHHAVETAGKAHRSTPEALGIRPRTHAENVDLKDLNESVKVGLRDVPAAPKGLESLRGSVTPVAPAAPSGLESLRGSVTPINSANAAPAASDAVTASSNLESLRGSVGPIESQELNPSMDSASFANMNNPQVSDVMEALAAKRDSAASLASLGASATPIEVPRSIVGSVFDGYVPGTRLSPEMLARLDAVSSDMVTREADNYFGYNTPNFPYSFIAGHDNLAWKSWSNRPIDSVLQSNVRVLPKYQPFIRDLHAYAEKYPNIRHDQSVAGFLKQVYSREVEGRALKGEFSE